MNLERSQTRIRELMSIFVAQVKAASAMNQTDINKLSENVLLPLFKEVFGYVNLKNLNHSELANYPAIDLGDEKERIAIQVTSESNSEKIKDTLEKFVRYRLFEKFDRLIIYILTEKQKTYSGKSFNTIIKNSFHFDKARDILDFKDVLKKVAALQIMESTRIEEILEANFGNKKAGVQVPNVPDNIQALFDEGFALRDVGKYEEARDIFQKALELASDYGHVLAAARAKYALAIILHEWDKNTAAAKSLLQECLQDFRTLNAVKHVAQALHQLGVIELDVGNLDQAEAYFSQNLELDKSCNDKKGIALTHHMLGWLEDHRGRFKEALDYYDQALTYWLGVYQEDDPKTAKDAILSIAGSYHHKGLVYENLGNIEEVETNYMRALEWCRKSDFKPDVGKILYLLARLKYREGQYDEGTQFLDEATEIYKDLGDSRFYALCLDLKGRILFTLGQRHKAISVFEDALAAVEKADDYKEQVTYLNKLGQIFLQDEELDKAKDYFEQAGNVALRESLLNGYADAVKGLAQIAYVEKNQVERDRLLFNGIKTLEKLLLSLQGEPKRAFTIGQIGFFYESMENLPQALVYYQRAKKVFESLSDIGGIANCMGSIARIQGLSGQKHEEFDTYRELKKLVGGTPYYDIIAGTAINLGEIQMRLGNLDEAKVMFQEAELLCRKYNLHYLPHLEKSLRRLTAEINTRKPPELNLKELIEELFELIEWFPEAKDNLLRLWIYGRDNDLYVNYRNTTGIKLMVCQDDLDIFLRTANALHSYQDLSLQVVSNVYESGMDIVPFPMDKKMFFGSRYSVTSDTATSKTTGKGGVVLVGWTRGLPQQAHQLILSSSAADLIKQKVLFLPYERHLANDILLSDLRFSKDLGFIPLYFDSLPKSESVEILLSASIALPYLSAERATQQRKQIRRVKHSLTQLLSATRDSAQSLLNTFVYETDELSDSSMTKQFTEIKIYLLQFPSTLDRELHIALVLTKVDKHIGTSLKY
jgi:tetratricopeptide (TPR) repeat protein